MPISVKPAAGRKRTLRLWLKTCLDNGLFAEAVKYYGEVIPLHQRTAPNRGIGQWTLSNYYSNQARAYSRLGQTKEAVDAAAAGIVAWGPSYRPKAIRFASVGRSARECEGSG